MMNNINEYMFSVSNRFFPYWDTTDVTQIQGLLQLMLYIFNKNPAVKSMIEIGSLYGESASIFLAFPIEKLYCIDTWEDWSSNKKEFKFNISYGELHQTIFNKRLNKDILSKRCVPIQDYSHKASKLFESNSIDIIYIDGSHKYEDVLNDMNQYFPKLKTGGFLCGHDYHTAFGVIEAVDKFVADNSLPSPTIFQDFSFCIEKPII